MGGNYYFDSKSKRYFVKVSWRGVSYRFFRFLDGLPMKDEYRAKRLLEVIRADITMGTFNPKTYLPESPISTAVYTDRWLKTISAKYNTIKNYHYIARKYIKPYFGNTDMREIRYQDLMEFYQWIPRQQSGKYVVMTVLRIIMRSAWQNEDIPKMPPFPRLSIGNLPKVEYLTLEQQKSVLGSILESHRAVFAFGMEYGLRIGELRAIQWDCIDDKEITIKRTFADDYYLEESTKTGQIRTLPITLYAKQILSSLAVTSPTFVFVRENGRPYRNRDLNAIWHAACKEAGVKKIKLYNAIRHSLGCQLLDEGKELSKVQRVYGHKRLEMTRRYTDRTAADLAPTLENRHAAEVIQLKKDG